VGRVLAVFEQVLVQHLVQQGIVVGDEVAALVRQLSLHVLPSAPFQFLSDTGREVSL
jgi:hypothetical protein